MAVASAGPYANNLHLAPDRQPHQHLITQLLQATQEEDLMNYLVSSGLCSGEGSGEGSGAARIL